MESNHRPPEGDPRILRDQVEQIYRHYPQAQMGLAFGSLVLGFALWSVVPHDPILIWGGAMAAFILVRWLHFYLFKRYFGKTTTEWLTLWRNLFVAGVFVSGVLVATGIYVLFPFESTPHQYLMALIVLTFISGASVSYGTIVWASSLFFVPPLAALAARFYQFQPEVGWYLVIGFPVYGILMMMVSVQANRNITRTLELARRNEALVEELKVSEEKFRGLVENATDSIVLIQGDRIVYANKAAEQLSGYSEEELRNMPITALMADTPRGRERMYTAYQQRLAGEAAPQQYEAQALRNGGEMIDVLVSSAVVHLSDGVGVISMIKDITDLKKVERMKSELVTLVTHELRTPVTVIQSSLEALSPDLERNLSEEGREIFAIASNNADRLAHLVQDILNLDKLDAARMGYRMRPHEAQPLVEQAVSDIGLLVEAADLKLEVQPANGSLTVWCDFDRIIQVLSNFLTNAIKFSDPGGTVTIGASPGDGWVRFSVSNRGEGVPEEFRDRIFLPFSQADSVRADPNRGTGLGLSICKTIVEDHNGYIGFDSTPGDRTTFYFLLPEHQTAQPA